MVVETPIFIGLKLTVNVTLLQRHRKASLKSDLETVKTLMTTSIAAVMHEARHAEVKTTST